MPSSGSPITPSRFTSPTSRPRTSRSAWASRASSGSSARRARPWCRTCRRCRRKASLPLDVFPWVGLVAPLGVPPAIVEKINRDVTRVLDDPEGKSRAEKLGCEVVTGPPATFTKVIEDKVKLWSPMAREVRKGARQNDARAQTGTKGQGDEGDVRRRTYETGRRLQSKAFDDRVALRDSVDPHFTRLWLDYAIDGARPTKGARRAHALSGDGRTVHHDAQRRRARRDHSRCAGRQGAAARGARGHPAVGGLWRQCRRRFRLEDFRRRSRASSECWRRCTPSGRRWRSAMPSARHDRERASWHPDDASDPRRDEMMSAHDWRGISTGTAPASQASSQHAVLPARPR